MLIFDDGDISYGAHTPQHGVSFCPQDAIQPDTSRRDPTIRGSLTGQSGILSSSQLFILLSAIIAAKASLCQPLFGDFLVSSRASATALIPPASFPRITAGRISGENPAVKPR